MSLRERLGIAVLRRLDPETAHGLALRALGAGLAPGPGPVTSSRLECSLAGMELPNPLGLAAGFDKNAVAIEPLAAAGFGFLEFGAATPRPQPGNPRPRLFRLPEDSAVINRFGFNNEGIEAIAPRLAARRTGLPCGLNLGANKDSPDRVADYVALIRRAGPHVDFVTVNISSPNTEKLRDLQGPAALKRLLAEVMAANAELHAPVPVFLKIAPDLDDAGLAAVAAAAGEARVAGIVATNTTLSRAGLRGAARDEAGGLSGAPLFAPSTRVLARLSMETGGALPLIGVGGIASAEDAYAKIRAGASALQIYTALAIHGLSLVETILRGLDALLARDGYDTLAAAVGSGRADWLD